MSGLLPALRPACDRHGPMDLRPASVQTKEQAWCGTWYDCARPDCRTSVLLPAVAAGEQTPREDT